MVDAARCVRHNGRRRDARKERVRSVKSREGMDRADEAVCCGVKSEMKDVEQPTALSFAARQNLLDSGIVVLRDAGRYVSTMTSSTFGSAKDVVRFATRMP